MSVVTIKVMLIVLAVCYTAHSYFMHVCAHPSPHFIASIQTYTITGIRVGEPFPPYVEGSNASAAATQVPRYASLRYTSKLHLTLPLLLFQDYPVAYYLAVTSNLSSVSWLTANFISMSHPLFALLATYLLVTRGLKRGASSITTNSSKAFVTNDAATNTSRLQSPRHHDVYTPTSAASSSASRSYRTAVSAATNHQRSNSGLMPKSPTLLGSDVRALSSDALEAEQCDDQLDQHNNDVELGNVGGGDATTTAGSGDGAPLVGSGSEQQDAAATSGSRMQRLLLVIAGAKESPAKLVASDMVYVRLAVVAWALRNFLDTFDGVMARVYKLRGQQTGKLLGMSGPEVDAVFDVVGTLVGLFGLGYFLVKKQVVVSRFVSHALCRLGMRFHMARPLLFGRIVMVLGFLYIPLAGKVWEVHMFKHMALFDKYANDNWDIFQVEQSTSVRLNQWLLSISYADSSVAIMLIALFFDKLWVVVQCFCFLGHFWELFLLVQSVYVWHWVVLANPTAAQIVLESQQP